jgi:hypothetical protein
MTGQGSSFLCSADGMGRHGMGRRYSNMLVRVWLFDSSVSNRIMRLRLLSLTRFGDGVDVDVGVDMGVGDYKCTGELSR